MPEIDPGSARAGRAVPSVPGGFGVDITDSGMPAEFDICPLLHVASIEPFSLHDSNPAA